MYFSSTLHVVSKVQGNAFACPSEQPFGLYCCIPVLFQTLTIHQFAQAVALLVAAEFLASPVGPFVDSHVQHRCKKVGLTRS